MRDLLRQGLEDAGFAVATAADGGEGLREAGTGAYDAVVLDVMLPVLDGFAVCQELRRTGVPVPVLMLTARDSVADRVAGLDGGADDYLVKPFAFAELLSRLRALLRRGTPKCTGPLRCGPLVVDPARHVVECRGEEVDLSAKEFSLLCFLMENHGQALARSTILEHVWDYRHDGFSNVDDVYVKYLRDKIDRRFGLDLLQTVRGIGYRLSCPAPPHVAS